jgi:hypothetical protein
MKIKSFGIVIIKGSVVLEITLLFVFIIIALKKEISRKKVNNIYFIL